jgi:general secretion pathway protein D
VQPLEGEVSLHTHRPVARDQLLGILEAMLQSNGYLMQPDNNGRLAIGSRDSMRANVPIVATPGALPAGFGTVVVPLQYVSATEMAEILQPVTAADNILRIDTARNLLMLAGTQIQVQGWLDMVDIFDVDYLRGMSVGLFPLTYMSVEEAEVAIRAVLGIGGGETARATGRVLSSKPVEGEQGRQRAAAAGAQVPLPASLEGLVRVMPVERLNALLVVTPRAHFLEKARQWIERFDQPADSAFERRLYVYEVQNGTATHIASVLNGVFGGGGAVGGQARRTGTGVAPGLATGGVGEGGLSASSNVGQESNVQETTQLQLEGEIRVVADELNNALLIYASQREYRRIEAALRQIDVLPTQVLIEASILEVTLTDELNYGLQWFFSNALGGLGDGYQGIGQLTQTATGAIGAVNPGFSYSISSPDGSFQAVLSALAQRSLLNVISTPSLMVLDNHSAVIRVGDQQPIRTSETTNTDGDNITTTIEYKDTGVLLEVSPSVNAGGMVSMTVRQSIIDVGQIDIATGQRSFLQRDVTSRVAVRSGETIVLGGLIRDNNNRDKQGLPVLHEIPVVGNLFGSTSVSSDRTELLVMITPRVVRSEQDVRDVNQEFRERMRSLRWVERRVLDEGEPTEGASGFSTGMPEAPPPELP